MVLLLVLLFLLLIMIAFSLYLAYSGYLEGRTYIGWVLLFVYFAIYLTFMLRWLSGIPLETLEDAPRAILFMLICALFLVVQGPLVIQLISLAVIPDPSSGLKLIKVYSEAEKKVVQDDLPGAILEYEKVIAEDPEDIVARFRLADLCHQNEDYRKAAMAYESIIARKKQLSTSQHCSALTRLSELYAEHLHDVQKARIFVQAIIEQYPGTKYAGYATERLKNLPDA